MIVYDIETLRGPDEVEGGWANPEGMGFGCAIAYLTQEKRHLFFNTEGKDELTALLTQRQEFVISFNGIRFDNRVLLGNDREGSPWPNDDLLVWAVQKKFGVQSIEEAQDKHGSKAVHNGSIGLNGLAWGTLRGGKTGQGAHAPQLIRENKWDEVLEYCLQDVRLTWRLWKFRQRHGFLVDKNDTVIRGDEQ